MQSKPQQKQKLLQQLVEKMKLILKKYCFQRIKMLTQSDNLSKILFRYVGKQSQKKLRWLFSVDKFQPSQKAAKINQDIECKTQVGKIIYSYHQHRLQGSKVREALRKVPISVHVKAEKEQKIKKYHQKKENSMNDAIPLGLDESSKIFEEFDESNEDDDYINKIRQRKNKRQLFKSRLAQEQYSKSDFPTKRKEIKEPQITNKKQKCNLCPHFIEVDASIKQSEKQALSRIIPHPLHKKHKTLNKSLNNSPVKQVNKKNSLIYTTREWQPLKTQDRQLVLKPVHQLKLSLGVTTRQNSNKSINCEVNSNNSSPPKKKLMLLKNNDKHPAKIRLNELLSLKKLGTMTHLAYCTSMKTMKDIKDTKENIQSNLSIDSKQFPSEVSVNQKRLIKIANRKIFEQLLAQESDPAAQELVNYKFKMRLKKQGKVRFDNIV